MAAVCTTAPSVVSAVAQQRSQPILPARCAATAGGGSGRRHGRPRRQRRQHVCSASGSATSSSSEAQQLLDQFWQARGVVDEQQRRQLVAAAGGIQAESGEEYYRQLELPTASAAWFLEEGASPEVAAVSRRILALQQLLGGGDIDVVWMLVREPRLLSADFRSIMQRLFDMKLAEGSEGLDVVGLVEQQPALLLQPDGASRGVTSDESAAERLQAWQHGLVSDNASEWARRYNQLQQYSQRHGDGHVGCRDTDDAELTRWATKQRSEHRSGQLSEEKREQLQAAGFEFDAELAEWLRWFNEICAFHQREGHCQPQPLAHPNDFLLINWCSVQRIMRRCRVLAPERVEMLDGLGFDWSGADPLS